MLLGPRVLDVVCIAMLSCGCGKILGVDQYAVGGPPAAVCADPFTAPDEKGICQTIGPACAGPNFIAGANGGCRAVLPASDCASTDTSPMGAYPGSVDCQSVIGGCDQDPPRWLTFEGSPYYYADPAAAPGGDGKTPAHAFASIRDALGATPQPRAILLHSGVYRENVDLTIPVGIWGACPSSTHIVGTDPTMPTVHIGPGADGAGLHDVDVSGDPASTGIAIEGDGGLHEANQALGTGTLAAVWIHDVRQGIAIDDSGQTSPMTLAQVLLERIGEHGITIRGSSVAITQTVIRDVGSPSLSPTIESAAVDSHPSRHAPHQGLSWDPWHSTRSSVEITDSLVERAPVGLLLEGSDAKVSTTLVRDTTTGVVARWRPLGPVPGDVTIDHSVIEGSAEIGVLVWNARATITDTTVRSTGANCPVSDAGRPVGAHPGNAVRARFDRVPGEPVDGGSTYDPSSQALAIEHSLLDSSRQAGVHVEGGTLTIDHTLVRGTSAEVCTGALGDGVMVYSHPGFPPATVTLTTARISGSAGPGLAAFGLFAAPLSFQGTMIDGSAGIARDSPAIGIAGDPECIDGGTAMRCTPTDGKAARSVSVADCTQGKSQLACVIQCAEALGAPGALPSAPVVAEVLREPGIAPVVSDSSGCAEGGAFEAGRVYQFGYFSDAFAPAQGPYRITEDSTWTSSRGRGQLVTYATLGGATTLPSQGFGPGGFDLALGLTNAVWACQGPTPTVASNVPVPFPTVCPTGMQGWAPPEIVDAPAGTLGPNATNEGLVPVGPPAKGARVGGLWYFFNVAPGDYELRLNPPAGVDGQCTPYFFWNTVQSSEQFGTSSTASSPWTDLLLRVEAGYANSAGDLYCTP